MRLSRSQLISICKCTSLQWKKRAALLLLLFHSIDWGKFNVLLYRHTFKIEQQMYLLSWYHEAILVIRMVAFTYWYILFNLLILQRVLISMKEVFYTNKMKLPQSCKWIKTGLQKWTSNFQSRNNCGILITFFH